LTYYKPKPGENFYDLGSGTGRSMLIASKKFNLNIFGFELSSPIAAISKFNFWINGVKKSKINLKNFYNEDLSNADIIFCFLTPKAMLRLKDKFEKELKPGTRIISYAFSIPNWNPDKVIFNNTPGKTYCYIKK
jgi:predicted RNA methylase